MTRVRGFVFAGIAGVVLGIWSRAFFDFGWTFFLWFVVLGGILLTWALFKKEKTFALVSCGIVAVGLGMGWYSFLDRPAGQKLSEQIDNSVALEGVVVSEPDIRENSTRLTVALEKITTPEGQTFVKDKILIVAKPYPEFSYGDRLKIEGKLSRPENFTTGEEKEFDWVGYLAKDNVHFEIVFPRIGLLEHNAGNLFKSTLFSFKHSFLNNIAQVISEPENSLAGGLIVGAKHSLGKDLLDAFRNVGIIHIIVLSGYNLTIVATFLMWLFSFLSKRLAFGLGVAGIILFTLMTGAGAATTRAAIMAIIAMTARNTGRTYAPTLALVFAGFLMILVNPKMLIFDAGFQLSFIATLGLIYFAPIVEKKLLWVTKKFKAREFVAMTISAQIAVLPWLLYKTGNLSIFALPVNLLILGFIPYTMLFGFLAGAVGFVSTILSYPFGWIAYLMLVYELGVVRFFNTMPFSTVYISNFPLGVALVIYAAYIWWLWYYSQYAKAQTNR